MTVNKLLDDFEVLVQREIKEDIDLTKEKDIIRDSIRNKMRRAILSDAGGRH